MMLCTVPPYAIFVLLVLLFPSKLRANLNITLLSPLLPSPLQQLQMTSNLINQALRRGANAQHSPRPRGNLRTASILNHLSSDAQAARLGHQLQHLILGLGLHGDLGLAVALPLAEQAGGQRHWLELGGGEEALVAGEGGVGALGCDFTCLFVTEASQ